eukprot:TRINITY_DN1593_c0_g1_i3.p1 TRINITY_DN1593_c0_g1~~TRINITY_DN1593_c0_g1_i3.p1  ORF type:complete len:158 (-),score=48.88 TRINITY_DN1593_c0_g1_i3:66-539(-)
MYCRLFYITHEFPSGFWMVKTERITAKESFHLSWLLFSIFSNEYITMTTQEYDLGKVKEAFQQILMTSLMISGIHYKWGYGVPLIIQFVTVPLNLYKNDLIKVHFLGQDIARPFPVPQSPFAALLEGGAAGGATPQEEERKRKKEEKKEQKKSKKVD